MTTTRPADRLRSLSCVTVPDHPSDAFRALHVSRCEICDGTGEEIVELARWADDDDRRETCDACGGSGEALHEDDGSDPDVLVVDGGVPCSHCRMAGFVQPWSGCEDCRACNVFRTSVAEAA